MKLCRLVALPLLILIASIVITSSALAATAVKSSGSSIKVRPVEKVDGKSEILLHIGVESWSGDTTYQVGYPVRLADGTLQSGHFPFSELKFPLDAVFATIKLNALFQNTWVVDLVVKKNISDPDDNLEDSDWLSASNPNRLDVYSTSEVFNFSAFTTDLSAAYKFVEGPQGWLAGGAGYMYQDFEFEARLIEQYSPSGNSTFNTVGDGVTTAIDYEVTYYIPYFLLTGQFNPVPGFTLGGRLAYSPWTNVEDRDQHLLRFKENKGDMDGSSLIVSLTGQFDFDEHWFMTAGVDHITTEADGSSDASFRGNYDHTVTEEIDSSQTAVYITGGYRFDITP